MRLASSPPTYNRTAVIRPQFGNTAPAAAIKPGAEADKPMIEIIIENEKDAAEAKKPVSFMKKALNNVSELTKGSITAGGKKVANETVAIVLIPLGLLLANRLSGGKLSRTLFSMDAEKEIAKKATEKSLERKYWVQNTGFAAAGAASMKILDRVFSGLDMGANKAWNHFFPKPQATAPVTFTPAQLDLINRLHTGP